MNNNEQTCFLSSQKPCCFIRVL